MAKNIFAVTREGNYEQEYGQEEGSEEEASEDSAGEARREKGEEAESRFSDLRCPANYAHALERHSSPMKAGHLDASRGLSSRVCRAVLLGVALQRWCAVVRPERFELPTSWFVGACLPRSDLFRTFHTTVLLLDQPLPLLKCRL